MYQILATASFWRTKIAKNKIKFRKAFNFMESCLIAFILRCVAFVNFGATSRDKLKTFKGENFEYLVFQPQLLPI